MIDCCGISVAWDYTIQRLACRKCGKDWTAIAAAVRQDRDVKQARGASPAERREAHRPTPRPVTQETIMSIVSDEPISHENACKRFAMAVLDATPNGEWIEVQFHPNNDWSVGKLRPIPIGYEGLVERLLRTSPASSQIFSAALVNPDGPEAAEAITTLLTKLAEIERENARLRKQRNRLTRHKVKP